MGEIGECLVDRLPGRAHELRDLLLRQIVGHAQRATFLRPEPLCQLQQLLGHPARHVGEDQVGEVVVGASQPAGQHPQQLLGDLRPIRDPGTQCVAVHRHRAHLGGLVALEVRGPGSKMESSPNMSDGPMIVSRFSRPSENDGRS